MRPPQWVGGLFCITQACNVASWPFATFRGIASNLTLRSEADLSTNRSQPGPIYESAPKLVQVGAEEPGDCVVELLVKLRPIETRRVFAKPRLLLGKFRRADRQE